MIISNRFICKCMITFFLVLQTLCLRVELQDWLDANNKDFRWELQWSAFQENDRADIISHLTSLLNDSNDYMELFKALHSKLGSIDVPLGLQRLDNNSKKHVYECLRKITPTVNEQEHSKWFIQARDAMLNGKITHLGTVSVAVGWQEVLRESHQKEHDPKNNNWDSDNYE